MRLDYFDWRLRFVDVIKFDLHPLAVKEPVDFVAGLCPLDLCG